MTVQQAIAAATEKLSRHDIASARLDSELMAAHILGRDRTWLHAHGDEAIGPDDFDRLATLIDRRAAHEPLVHLTGQREFYGHSLTITPDVLTPRVETEQMVEWAVKYAPEGGSLIDVGTGSGAIAIAVKLARQDLSVTGTEVSRPALSVARDNASRLQADVDFLESDLWANVHGAFDVVCTNLPYLRDDARAELMEEVKHEPDVALFGGEDGLDLYRRFLRDLPRHLNGGGYLFTECDPWQHESLIAEAARYGLTPVEQGYFILGFRLPR